MKTDELIRALRDWAGQMTMPGRRSLVNAAADRLEELDERVAIMSDGNQITMDEMLNNPPLPGNRSSTRDGCGV